MKIDCALETYKPLHLKPLSDTSTLERLTIVKHLSTNLLSFGKNPTVFQLRNSSIISFSSDFVNEYLEDKLYKFGIKNILLDDSIYETLVATMHDVNRQVIILTEDLLFSLENYESFESQFMVLQQAMKSGCELKNIDSKELFDSLGLILNELVEELEDINFVKTDQKNQILLELN